MRRQLAELRREAQEAELAFSRVRVPPVMTVKLILHHSCFAPAHSGSRVCRTNLLATSYRWCSIANVQTHVFLVHFRCSFKVTSANLQDVEKKADVVAEAMAALQREEAAKEDALQQVAAMQAVLQRAQVSYVPGRKHLLLCTASSTLWLSQHGWVCSSRSSARYWTSRRVTTAQSVARADTWGSLLMRTLLQTQRRNFGQRLSSPMQDTAREADVARRAAEDSAAGQAAALAATRRRADTYREENRALLANYDDWLRTLVQSRPGNPPQSAEHIV